MFGMMAPECAGELLLELPASRGNGIHILIYRCSKKDNVLHIGAQDPVGNTFSCEYVDDKTQPIEEVVALLATAVRKNFEDLAANELRAAKLTGDIKYVN